MIKRFLFVCLSAIFLSFFSFLFSCAYSYGNHIPAYKLTGDIYTVEASMSESLSEAGVTPIIQSNKNQTDSQEDYAAAAACPVIGDNPNCFDLRDEDYIIVPRFYNMNADESAAFFSSFGIITNVVKSETKCSECVFDISFEGWCDESRFYIKAGSEITLKIGSLQASAQEKDEQYKKDSLPEDGKPGGKVAYLTFDDGPTKSNTENILEILNHYNIKATFFVVGNAVERFPNRVKAIYDMGNSIGCHSYSHDYTKIYTNAEGFLHDLYRWYEAISAELGEDYNCSLYRMPGGSAHAKKYAGYDAVKEALINREFKVFDWTMSNNDVWSKSLSGSMSAVEYEKQCLKEQLELLDKLCKPIIILMHETYDSTVEMLPWAIELLQGKGYSFGTLEDYGCEYLQH